MGAAIQLSQQLVATATLGRISSRYPTGRAWLATWRGPRINYPRPVDERDNAAAGDLGLHTECDKWVAGYAWSLCLGVSGGAFPYRVAVRSEVIDGLPASAGLSYVTHIEDATEELPFLSIVRDAGWTAPSGGIKAVGFTIEITDCANVQTSVAIDLDVYAQDHANIRANFRVCDLQAAGGGDGSPATPYNSWAALWGTDYNSTTECPSICIAIFKGTGTITGSALANLPGGTNGWHIGSNLRPRQIIALRGSAIEYDGAAYGGIRAIAESSDCLVKNIVFKDRTGSQMPVVYAQNFRSRCGVHEVTVRNWEIRDAGANTAAITGDINEGSDFTILNYTLEDVYTTVYHVNAFAGWTIQSCQYLLVDNVTVTGLTKGNGVRFAGIGRTKHHSRYTEFRRVNAPGSGGFTQEGVLVLGTGEGTSGSAYADDNIEAIVRYNNLAETGGSGCLKFTHTNTGDPTDEVHSVLVYFNSFRGGLSAIGSDYDAAVQSGAQLHATRNIVQNANAATNQGFGSLDADWRAVTGKAAIVEDNIAATSGVLDTAGLPIDSAHVRRYGHTL